MFSLALPTEPRWLDLPMGVRVKVRPLDGLVITAARRHVQREVLKMREDRTEREAAGVPADDTPDLDDPNMAEAMFRLEFARALAKYGVMDFDGVGDASGSVAVPFSSEMAQALVVHPDMMDAFLTAYLAPTTALATEGNGSAVTLNGSTGGAASIAADAMASVPDAQGPTAVH
jgi:hypothetical protein